MMQKTTRLLAAAAAVLGMLSMSGCAIATTLAGGDTSPSSSPTQSASASSPSASSSADATATKVNFLELQDGNCFDESDEPGYADLYPDCSAPHSYEVFEVIEMQDANYPGDSATKQIADAQCTPAFERFVGVPASSSSLSLRTLYPSLDTWQVGDRAILCVVASRQPMTGSAEGAKR